MSSCRFQSRKDVLRAVASLQGASLEGHNIQLKLSNKRSTLPTKRKAATSSTGEGQSKTKLLVKNLAFEANAKELRELFSTFGHIKKCKVPKKIEGGHRGFAFIDFVTQKEAENAFSSLQDSHLYGRHLVIEWAKDDDSLASIRDKTIEQYKKGVHGSGARNRVTGKRVTDSSQQVP